MTNPANLSPLELARQNSADFLASLSLPKIEIENKKSGGEKNASEDLFFCGELNSEVASGSTAGQSAVVEVQFSKLPPAIPCVFCGSGVIWFSRGNDRPLCDECDGLPAGRSKLFAVVESVWMLVGGDCVEGWTWQAVCGRSGSATVKQAVVDDPDFPPADFFYPLISPADRLYLATKIDQTMCGFCGGRGGRHNPVCCTLRDDWFSVMPWGKHKGEKLAAMAKTKDGADYLRYLLKSGRVSGELRDDVERVLGVESERKHDADEQ